MSVKSTKTLFALSLSTLIAITLYAPVSQGLNFGNMMNPSRWMDGDRHDDRYDEPYYDAPYGGGYGPGPYGAPYGAPYGVPGFGPPPAGYGAPGYYGAPPAPTAPGASSPSPTSSNADKNEIEALKRRIEELETRQQPNQQPKPSEWPSAPAFRPMNQY